MTAVSLVLLRGMAPAPRDVIDALQELVVETTLDGAGSFRLRLGTRQTPGGDWPLLDPDIFPPLEPVRVGLIVGANPLPTFVLVGYVATQSVVYSETPGGSSVEIGAVDRTALMNLEEKAVAWPNLPDALIATQIFASHQLLPQVSPTPPVLVEPEGTTVQRGSDIRFLRRLARRNGFEVYTLPQPNTGLEVGYFGAVAPAGPAAATLSLRAGDATTVTDLRVAYDMLRPTTAVADGVDFRHTPQSASATSVTATVGRNSALARISPAPVTRLTGTGLTNAAHLRTAAQAAVDRAGMALTVEGTVDASVGPLRPADRIRVAGAGRGHSGSWTVRKVVHRLTPEGYTQRFTAVRNAVGNDEGLADAAAAAAQGM